MTRQTGKKKVNTNILLFVFAMLFLAVGLCGDCIKSLKSDLWTLRNNLPYGNPDSISIFIDDVNEHTSTDLIYYDRMLDLDSVRNNLLGTRVVETTDATVVKTDSGRLIDPYKELKTEAINAAADEVLQLQQLAETAGSKFLCCSVPWGGVYETTPSNMPNYDREHYYAFSEALRESGVPCLGLVEAFQSLGLQEEELFFRTDHHLRPSTGFAAYQAICNELRDRYGFPLEQDYADVNNYRVDTYENWFLGSYGKKVGRFFTWDGAEDFEVITPLFPTNFTETVAGRDEIRSGSFTETMLYPEFLGKDYYHAKNYCFYSGGDFHLQVIRNNLRPDGAKVLVIRNSFACVVTPFLALQTGELHVIDDRNASHVFGPQVDIEDYILELKPDYVLVLKAF